ncbi:MAG: hypothetical protein DMG79_10280 [Acidobacteria bacterium]|nr:MAG: hypothetical protein DMG79_10280 [Acidobacteriota bacterium]
MMHNQITRKVANCSGFLLELPFKLLQALHFATGKLDAYQFPDHVLILRPPSEVPCESGLQKGLAGTLQGSVERG